MEHIEFTKIMHLSREPPKPKGSYQCLSKKMLIYAAANIEPRNCEILIFLFSPIYFIVGLGRHIEYRIVICIFSAVLSNISGNEFHAKIFLCRIWLTPRVAVSAVGSGIN